MSRWLDRANWFAAYTRATVAAVTRWPSWRVLIAGAIGVVLFSAVGWADTLDIAWAPPLAMHEHTAADKSFVVYRISTLDEDGRLVSADVQDIDVGSDPVQRKAMTRARDSGRLVAPPPTANPADIFLFAPVYSFDLPYDGVEDRHRTPDDFIRGVFLFSPMIDRFHRGVSSPQGLYIYFFRLVAGLPEHSFRERPATIPNVPPRGM